jgi:carboxypeptidase family protein
VPLRIGPATIVLVVLVTAAVMNGVACMPHGPVVDTGSKPQGVGGTIAGLVRSNAGTPLIGRKVTATNVESGQKFEASTATNGGYTMKVPTGKYRLEVELHAGEALEKPIVETEVNTGDLDPHCDFVVTVKAPR